MPEETGVVPDDRPPAHLHLLPPGALHPGAGGADPAAARRPVNHAGRAGVPGGRGDHGTPAGAGQAQDQGRPDLPTASRRTTSSRAGCAPSPRRWSAKHKKLGRSCQPSTGTLKPISRHQPVKHQPGQHTRVPPLLARDLPETALHVTASRPTTRPSAAPSTCADVWGRGVLNGGVNHPRIDGKDGIAGSIPAGGSTPTPQVKRVRAEPVEGPESRQLPLPEICQSDLHTEFGAGRLRDQVTVPASGLGHQFDPLDLADHALG